MLRYDIDVRFSAADDAVIERTVSASGYFAARHRAYFRYTEPYVVVQNIQEKTKKINPFAELLDYKIEYHPGLSFDPVLQYRFKAPHPLLRAGKLRIVPLLNEIDFEEEWIAPEKREYPLDLSMLQTVQVKTNIHYGKYFSLYYIPTSFRITNPWFDFSVDYQKTADTIYYTEDFRLKKDIISPTEYSSFKKQMETALLKVRDQIILEEQKP